MDLTARYTVRWDDLSSTAEKQIVHAAMNYSHDIFGRATDESYRFNSWWKDTYHAKIQYLHPDWLIEFGSRDAYTRFVLTWL